MAQLKRTKSRFREALQRSFFVRAHMFVILFSVVALGVLTSWIFLRLGVSSMPVRYAVSVALSYLFFLVAVRLWISHVSSKHSPDQGPASTSSLDLHDLAIDGCAEIGDSADAASISVAGGQAQGSSSSGGSSFDLGDDPSGVIIVIVIGIAVAIFFGVGIYLVWEAPVILGEAAFQAVLAGSLRRRAKAIDAPGWAGSVLKATAIPLVIALATAIAAGVILQGLCPDAVTVAQVLDSCVSK